MGLIVAFLAVSYAAVHGVERGIAWWSDHHRAIAPPTVKQMTHSRGRVTVGRGMSGLQVPFTEIEVELPNTRLTIGRPTTLLHRVYVGDPFFDGEVAVNGEGAQVFGALSADVRSTLRELNAGRLAFYQAGGVWRLRVSGRLGDSAVAQIVAAIDRVQSEFERAGPESLAKIALNDPVPEVRRRALKEVKDPEVLLQATNDRSAVVRIQAWISLRSAQLLQVPDGELREFAALAPDELALVLEELGAERALIGLLAWRDHVAFVQALGRIGGMEALDALAAVPSAESKVAAAQIRARRDTHRGEITLISSDESGRVSISANGQLSLATVNTQEQR